MVRCFISNAILKVIFEMCLKLTSNTFWEVFEYYLNTFEKSIRYVT